MATKKKKQPIKKPVTQAKKKPTTNAKKPTVSKKISLHPLMYEIIGLIMIGIAIIMIFELGPVGRLLTSLSMYMMGNLHGIIPLLLIIQALMFMIKKKVKGIENRIVIGSFLILLSFVLFSHIHLFNGSGGLQASSAIKETWKQLFTNDGVASRSGALGGGMVGAFLYALFYSLFDSAGAMIASIILLVSGVVLITGKAIVPYMAEYFPVLYQKMKKRIADKSKAKKEAESKAKKTRSEKTVIDEQDEKNDKDQLIKNDVEKLEDLPSQPIISAFSERIEKVEQKETETPNEKDTSAEDLTEVAGVTGEEENESYILPPTSLLTETPHNDQSEEFDSIQENAKKLENTFLSFGVKARVTQVHLGPAVTKYEVLPDTGVKVSRIVSLQDDIALALAASGIRIEAPIPGKSAIGIEVPNSSISTVSLREVVEAKENNNPESKLLVSLGRDVTGEAMMAELNKMPHMLIAGATGSGKSVCINGIIVSLLLRAKPHEVKMMMIDPKMVELNVYNGVPHLLAPVVTDPRKAAQALQKVVSEMERRYELFSHTGTRNLEGYNEHIDEWNIENEEKHPHMPYIVVIVDELADLMMVASSDVEDSITRLAQMARAAGIHLIIATQRPSVDVITGVIKANIPSRIAFAVSSAIDSRTILDSGGAEKLLGRGDMLYLPAGKSKPVRIQGAFVSDREVEAVVDFVIEQQKAQYQEEMIPTEVVEVPPHEETDELYDEVVQLIVDSQTASVSLLQRRFRIGYARAARIVDQLQARGVVGPPDGSRPRQVLIGKDESDVNNP